MFNFRPEKARIVRATNERKICLSNRIHKLLRCHLENRFAKLKSAFCLCVFKNFLRYSAGKRRTTFIFLVLPRVSVCVSALALKIILQNPNLVQKTSSDVKNYFHVLNFASFFVSLQKYGEVIENIVTLKIVSQNPNLHFALVRQELLSFS